jgi:hypothetical protein
MLGTPLLIFPRRNNNLELRGANLPQFSRRHLATNWAGAWNR